MSIVKGIFTAKYSSQELTEEIDLASLFEEFNDRLVYFSLQFVKDKYQAQDIVQDAFIKYWQQKDTVLSNKTAVKNFLYSTVRNASLNIIRHEKIVEGYKQEHGGTEPGESSVVEAIIATEVIADIHSALQSLPENYRLISVMGYFDGKKNQEIADELNMSINTVKKQKQRALELLRLKLTPEMFVFFFIISTYIHKYVSTII
ncbi:MAG TPA: RNA polymerase sigma-70 factor [Pedobacter sp.]